MANIYTCTTATGNIDGLSTETSGNVKVNYTLSSSTAGTAGGNSDDGTYEDVVAFDSGIALAGYTGVLTVNSVNGLSTKTQRTEKRLLTHTDAKLSSEEIINGDFATGDTTGWQYSGTGTVVYENGAARVTATANGSGGIYQTLPDMILVLGGKYLVSCDITVDQLFDGTVNIQLYGNSVFYTITETGTYSVSEVVTITDTTTRFMAQFLGGDIGDNYLIDNISVKQLTTENKYYIDDIEQAVTPPLPDPNTTINLGNTCIIGYPDKIDTIQSEFNVYSEVIVP